MFYEMSLQRESPSTFLDKCKGEAWGRSTSLGAVEEPAYLYKFFLHCHTCLQQQKWYLEARRSTSILLCFPTPKCLQALQAYKSGHSSIDEVRRIINETRWKEGKGPAAKNTGDR
ncbi:hypothetical protein BT96DRAFT_952051 [Gymnopus androsaceus JB14]|uniref:Uncharacterized protein n=1 Tax=Gymnopus androsaceus JB14 TaxID=1447944 RepID=A0A6A4GAU0_9AGAR|nr:hypothetical protein BT96DRAFT_952051 [Gymnopus androsaceus JB14]